MIKLALVARGADGNGRLGAQEIFPRQVRGLAVQFGKCFSLELAPANEYAAGRARPQVHARQVGEETSELYATGDGARVIDAQSKQLGAGDVFEAGWGDGEKCKTK